MGQMLSLFSSLIREEQIYFKRPAKSLGANTHSTSTLRSHEPAACSLIHISKFSLPSVFLENIVVYTLTIIRTLNVRKINAKAGLLDLTYKLT